ncbi:bone morphogenetic protein 1-like isoform X2 [Anneissia japonica]|uniref:bone morphogenetic protein 1-like isoform X2 n=1 Tax=Anneissia japonica TaxID=1529436 RepID=UPI001425784F|nr:bone morphogenetic protein 1-like isoform X2 [Anneissia japonica]
MRTPSVLLVGPVLCWFWCFSRIRAEVGNVDSRIGRDESDQATTVSCSGRDMFQGDIVPDPRPHQEEVSSRPRRRLDKFLGASRQRRGVTAFKSRYWPNAEIPYLISQMFDNKTKTLIRQAISTYEKHTCLTFVPRTNQSDYVFFSVGEGCCSNVGRRGGKQIVSIGSGCDTFGTILHEIGHLVGFWHEQSRPDRDEHVTINLDNLHVNGNNQFHKQTIHQINSFGQPYDYGSIMHYGPYYFTINGHRTIVPVDQNAIIGQRERLSEGDIRQLSLMYRCTKVGECGGTMFKMEGEIKSPNYPSRIQSNTSCAWAISGEEENIALMLEINDIDLPAPAKPDGNCSNNSYVEVRDGFGEVGSLIGRFCGKVSPGPITIHSGGLWIKLHLINLDAPVRFYASFKTVSFNYKYTEFEGVLKTPHYPMSFPRNSKIVWKISLLEGFFVNLRIDELEVPESATGCRSDYLSIFDGETNESPLITKLCRSQKSVGVVSTGNHLRLEMHSDNYHDDGVKSRFYASYKARDIDECRINKGGCAHACMNLIGSYACGCRWGYRFAENSSNCTDIDECSHDDHGCSHLCINTDGSYYCACPEGFYMAPNGIDCLDKNECEDGSMLCEHRCFNTQGGYQCACDIGYILAENSYNCEEIQNCVRSYDDYEDYILSPNISSDNTHSFECLWHITVDQNLRISLGIEFQKWEDDGSCLDYIIIGQGQGPGSGITKICSIEDWPGEVDTISNSIWIKYRSQWPHISSILVNYFTEERGDHKQECGGTINETTTLETPGYPDFYPNKVDCIWKITGSKVTMSFENFDIEKQEDCQFDYVDIMDGDVEHPARIGRFCGSRSPPTVLRSVTGEVWIKFQSDATVQGKGFRAIVNVE